MLSLGVSYDAPVPALSISYAIASHDRPVTTLLLPMNTHPRHPASPQKSPPYRITLVGVEWHVRRPQASLSHAFAVLEQAETFVRNDSGARPRSSRSWRTACTCEAAAVRALTGRLHHPYNFAAFPISNSYAAWVHVAAAMRMKFPYSRSSGGIRPAGRPYLRAPDIQEPSNFPAPGEVLNEIGFLLAIHLAVALAVVMTIASLGLE